MNIYKLLLAAAVLLSGLNFSVQAQPKKSAAAQMRSVLACFEENEAVFASVAGGKLTGNDDTLRRLNDSLPILQKLIDCADRGAKITGAPLRTKRDLLARKNEYLSAQEIFSTQACIFGKLDETEKGIPETTAKIAEGNKPGALLNTGAIRQTALQAKLCAEQGINSKTITAEMKEGLAENLKRINSLLADIENLKKEIEKMPD